ncbi:MAG: hypothetical protein DSZ32_02390 [Gammaproteobacteria bacterium]|nr:MAG: hypothetical protein DSZ32_02390 [Gammaproteobacteria bacterium]
MKNIDAVYPVKVWSRWLRISHWLMAVSTLALIVSGWVLDYLETPDPLIRDYHYLFGHLLLASLILRGVLLFVRVGDHLQTESWKALRWNRSKAPAMLEMLKYYMSLGRMPKPAYYAHSPLWVPLYSILFLLLAVSALSGYLHDAPLTIAGFGLWRIHSALASILEILASLHVVSAVIQDISAPGGDISGMISGYRLFRVDKPADAAEDDDVQLVNFDADAGKDYKL